jgi:predicted RNA-binding Zn ribbon-like protein
MKTTVEIPDALLVAAKKCALETRRSLRELVEQGLRQQVRGKTTRAKAKPAAFRWITTPGGVPPGLNVADRRNLLDWLRRHP